jgi:dihydrofolate reductase
MRISLIAAVAANGVIGRDNQLPWHLPADLRHFQQRTLGHTLLMGRKTFESVGRPLPGRKTIVITRRPDYAPAGVRVAGSLGEALAMAVNDAEVFVAGGAEIFREALRVADRLYLTRIEKDFPGDVRFPEFDRDEWRLVDEERHEATPEVPYAYAFQTFDRRR